MTEDEARTHAHNMREATRVLNNLIVTAVASGLDVDVDVHTSSRIERRGLVGEPIVSVRVRMPV